MGNVTKFISNGRCQVDLHEINTQAHYNTRDNNHRRGDKHAG